MTPFDKRCIKNKSSKMKKKTLYLMFNKIFVYLQNEIKILRLCLLFN